MQEDLLNLTNTLYKLVEYFPEADPLKNKLKEKALQIMSRRSGIPPVAGESSIQEDVDLLLGFLLIAKNQGWLNDVNYLALSAEYGKIKAAENGSPPAKEVVKKEKVRLENLTGRKAKIVEFLEKKEKAQVMDLQKVLPDVTKRTIRRDLDELLGSGRIVRVGDFNQVFYRIK